MLVLEMRYEVVEDVIGKQGTRGRNENVFIPIYSL